MTTVGNTHEENHIALKVVEDWNANQGEEKGKVFIPVKPTNGQCPMPEVEVLIGIVGSFISDQDFFKAYVDAGKKRLLFLDTVHDASKSMKIEVQEVDVFKEPMEPRCACLSYNDSADYADALRGSICSI